MLKEQDSYHPELGRHQGLWEPNTYPLDIFGRKTDQLAQQALITLQPYLAALQQQKPKWWGEPVSLPVLEANLTPLRVEQHYVSDEFVYVSVEAVVPGYRVSPIYKVYLQYESRWAAPHRGIGWQTTDTHTRRRVFRFSLKPDFSAFNLIDEDNHQIFQVRNSQHYDFHRLPLRGEGQTALFLLGDILSHLPRWHQISRLNYNQTYMPPVSSNL